MHPALAEPFPAFRRLVHDTTCENHLIGDYPSLTANHLTCFCAM